MAPKADAKPKKAAVEEDSKDKVAQPDKDAFEAKVNKVQGEIEALQKKQAALTAQIKERSAGKEGFFNKKAEIRAQLDEIKAKIDALVGKKDEIKGAMENKRGEEREMRSQLNKTKKSFGFGSEVEIDERIASIEFQLCTSSMPLREEKKLLTEIQELKRSKPKVSQISQMEASLQNFDKGASMKENIGAINEEIAKLRDERTAVQEKLKELNESRTEQLGDLPQVIEKRDEVGKEIQAKIKERNEIRDEHRAAERAYYAYLAEQRKARQEKQAEERKARQAEYEQKKKEREAEKLDDQPFVAEITLIEQTMSFCKSLTGTKEEAKAAETKEVSYDNPDTHEVLISKKDRDEEFYFAPTKGKKSKGKAKTAKSDGKSIKHNAETFRLFDQLKLDAPITTDDIPAIMEKLEASLADYQQKVKEWEVNRDEMKRKILAGEVEEAPKEEETEEKAE